MAIAEVKKVSLIGSLRDKDAILRSLQQAGIVHLIPLKSTDTKMDSPLQLPSRAQEALHYLVGGPYVIAPCSQNDSIDEKLLVNRVLENKLQKRHLEDERDQLCGYIKCREIWGDFQYPTERDIGGVRLWYYVVPLNQLDTLKASPYVWQVLKQHDDSYYVTVLSESMPTPQDMPFSRVKAGPRSLQSLRDELLSVDRALDDCTLERASLTRWRNHLAKNITVAYDSADFYRAETTSIDDRDLFIIQGWMPTDHENELITFCEQQSVAWLLEAVSDADSPPTLLQPPAWAHAGKGIIEFFQIPAYRSWDPSPILWLSFCLFFAIIMSDAGYAASILLLLLMFRNRIKRSLQNQAYYQLIRAMAIAALVWGILVGSYFGYKPDAEHWLYNLYLIDLNDFDAMMRLSVGIGVLHLISASVGRGYYQRNRQLALAAYGWALVFAGGFIIWLCYLNDLLPIWDLLGKGMLVLGGVLAVGFSEPRDVRSLKDLLLRILFGLKSVFNISKAFGDVLSYLRLFALGLSSAQLALTFNTLAFDLHASFPGVGVFLCVVVLIVGHLLNFVLAIMGGVIHGLRLNLIEFSNWGMEQDGYVYKPFAKREVGKWKG